MRAADLVCAREDVLTGHLADGFRVKVEEFRDLADLHVRLSAVALSSHADEPTGNCVAGLVFPPVVGEPVTGSLAFLRHSMGIQHRSACNCRRDARECPALGY
jgi:hypothetical protein